MNNKIATAKLKYLHITPRKTRLVINTLKNLNVNEAEAQLLARNKRAAGPILKLLRSAMANAQSQNLDKGRLVIAKITVDEGPTLKRFMPRARGRATPMF
jgi:large subunit ribosomal protein L22